MTIPTFETIAAAIQNSPAAQNVDANKCAELGQDGLRAMIEGKIADTEWKSEATHSGLSHNVDMKMQIVKEIISAIS